MKQYRDEILLASLARRIKEIREAHHVSQIDFYIDTNINITRVERGTTNISISTLKVIADYFGLSLLELLKGVEK